MFSVLLKKKPQRILSIINKWIKKQDNTQIELEQNFKTVKWYIYRIQQTYGGPERSNTLQLKPPPKQNNPSLYTVATCFLLAAYC